MLPSQKIPKEIMEVKAVQAWLVSVWLLPGTAQVI